MIDLKSKVIFKESNHCYFLENEGVIFTVVISYVNSLGMNMIMLDELATPHLVDAKLLEVV